MPRRLPHKKLLPLRLSPEIATTKTTAASASAITAAAATRKSATHFLSLKQLRSLSLSLPLPLLRLIKTLARLFFSTTLSLFSFSTTAAAMDDDNGSTGFPSSSILHSDNNNTTSFLLRVPSNNNYDDDEEADQLEKLFLVPYAWWRESGCADEEVGVKYEASVRDGERSDEEEEVDGYSGCFGGYDDVEEIVLELMMKKDGSQEEGASGHEYALISGLMWARAFKR